MPSHLVQPYTIDVDASVLDDLRSRLRSTRWPSRETTPGTHDGVPLQRMQDLVTHWIDRYDWRPCERFLNRLGSSRTVVDGLGLHFLHVRSPHAQARPLLLCHGWPSSVLEFRHVVEALADPTAHGGSATDAFHVIVPSLPGHGFSDAPTEPGWGLDRIADAFAELVRRLRYRSVVLQGGDWGAGITARMAVRHPDLVEGLHLSMVTTHAPDDEDFAGAEARLARDRLAEFRDHESGYARIQATKPQTLAYGLSDSPAGQAAWIVEKFIRWTDTGGSVEDVLGRDVLLDNVMLYWLANAGASSARLYMEGIADLVPLVVEVPVACTIYPEDVHVPPRRWAEQLFPQLVHWGVSPRGGHFAALEQPGIFVEELRTASCRIAAKTFAG